MELAKRFRGMLADLGLKPAQAAKMLHVSLRTVHNWNKGTHQIPVMAYKLLRMMRYLELPGQSWQGWHFSRGMLITPEGRAISGKDGAWWSMLVRQAHSFGQLYRERNLERLAQSQADAEQVGACGLAAAGSVPHAGLVSVSTTHASDSEQSRQDGVIMGSWPTISDFPPLLMPMPESVASASESALTPCSASPWTVTCGETQRVVKPETVPAKPELGLLPLTGKPDLLPDSWLNRAYLGNRWQSPKTTLPNGQGSSQNSAKLKGGTSRHVNGRHAKASSKPGSQTAGSAS